MEERRKAVHMLVLDAVMVYVVFAAPGCSVCLVECFWDGLGSADKVSFNKIKYLKLKENISFISSSSVEFYKQ